ncbi:MAG: TetR/AcrR family transcriptional regulator [Bacilli bacterium]|jgi:AcrR family transcriptional regulator|nr:TetR/AcrR family transcriptional regulator [Bacilli bacterium]
MPKTPEQNRKIKLKRKSQILDASLRLFALKGYDSVVIEDITREAGCSHSLFYHYFKNKEEVFLEIIKMAEKRVIIKSNNLPNYDDTPAIEVIQLIVNNMIQEIFDEEEMPYFLYMFINLHLQKTLPTLSEKETRTKKPGFFRLFIDLVTRGQKEGDIAPGEPKQFAIIYFSIIKGLCFTRLNSTKKTLTVPNVDIIMNLFTRKGTTF